MAGKTIELNVIATNQTRFQISKNAAFIQTREVIERVY